MPHLAHVIYTSRFEAAYKDIAEDTRVLIAERLLEASRFPGLEWKRSCINAAKSLILTTQDLHLLMALQYRENLLHRLRPS